MVFTAMNVLKQTTLSYWQPWFPRGGSKVLLVIMQVSEV
jgi:hypothetical protein